MRDDDYGADEDHGMDASAETYVPPEVVCLGTLQEITQGPPAAGGDVPPGVISF
jgi:hypothetical protein